MSSNETSKPPASFVELEERGVIEPYDLLASLANYALNGWAINGQVVVGAARRANLTPQDLEVLGSLSQSGIERQKIGGRFGSTAATGRSEAGQYAIVADYARFELIMNARSN